MPLILAGLCFLVLWIWDRLDWYGSIGNNKAVGTIWAVIGGVVLLFVIYSKIAY